MSHFEAAGYRILSFKYNPTTIRKEHKDPVANQDRAGPISSETEKMAPHSLHDDNDNNNNNNNDDDDFLPSLSSLKTSLDKSQHPESVDAKSTSETPAGLPSPPTTFHAFGNLPTELRIKIWQMSFLPRVVELRPTRPCYAPVRTEDRRPQWQSGCTNPAALSVNSEARELALAHFRIALPLARITTAPPTEDKKDDEWHDVFAGIATSYWGKFSFTGGGKARLLKRVLYVSPALDTVVTLGLDSDLIRLKSMIDTLREEDFRGEGIRRLGLSVRDWGYGGSAIMLKGLGRSVLKDLDQLVLFMYSVPHPPSEFCEKGAAADSTWLEKYRKTGNTCELTPCEGSSAWQAYKMWSGTRGRQFWDDDGNIIKIGRHGNDLKVMDLEFKDGW